MAHEMKVWDRFWASVVYRDDCWQWVGYTNGIGYGLMRIGGGRRPPVQRLAYEWFVGPIPDGLVIDHLCRNRSCVNPAHLEAVTHHENILRGIGPSAKNAKKTHCPRGHEYTFANTRIRNDGKRACRACR